MRKFNLRGQDTWHVATFTWETATKNSELNCFISTTWLVAVLENWMISPNDRNRLFRKKPSETKSQK